VIGLTWFICAPLNDKLFERTRIQFLNETFFDQTLLTFQLNFELLWSSSPKNWWVKKRKRTMGLEIESVSFKIEFVKKVRIENVDTRLSIITSGKKDNKCLSICIFLLCSLVFIFSIVF